MIIQIFVRRAKNSAFFCHIDIAEDIDADKGHLPNPDHLLREIRIDDALRVPCHKRGQIGRAGVMEASQVVL